jgi:ribose-phosphate pyrophosphokinase
MKSIILLPTRQYAPFVENLVAHCEGVYGADRLPFEVLWPDNRKNFESGTIQFPLKKEDVKHRHVAVFGGFAPTGSVHEEIMETYFAIQGAIANWAASVHVVFPCFPYARQERKTDLLELPNGQFVAHLFGNAVSQASRVYYYLYDLHAEAIRNSFGLNAHTDHFYAKVINIQAINSIREAGHQDAVLASLDGGRSQWVESLANEDELKMAVALMLKGRVSGQDPKQKAISASVVKGVPVIIFDDEGCTWGSVKTAAKGYLDAGATKVFVVVTHGVSPAGYLDTLMAEEYRGQRLVEQVFMTDSMPQAIALSKDKKYKDFLTVNSLAPVIRTDVIEEMSAMAGV